MDEIELNAMLHALGARRISLEPAKEAIRLRFTRNNVRFDIWGASNQALFLMARDAIRGQHYSIPKINEDLARSIPEKKPEAAQQKREPKPEPLKPPAPAPRLREAKRVVYLEEEDDLFEHPTAGRIDWPTVARRILAMRGPSFLAEVLHHKAQWERANGLKPVQVKL